MRVSPSRGLFFVLLAVAFGACDRSESTDAFAPVGPEMAARAQGCDVRSMARDARSYFPGNGNGSPKDAVLDLVSAMQDDCEAGDAAGYTAHWFEMAGILQQVLANGLGGDAADGASFLAASITLEDAAGNPIFDPCEGNTTTCQPWDGAPALPNFEGVLDSMDGAWAVVQGNGHDVVCSGFLTPCAWQSADGDAWGVKPDTSWAMALHGLTSVLFGYPLPGPSPTGEALLNTDLPAFQWLLIPDPDEFTPGELQVGLCSDSFAAGGELLVQKGSTILEETSIDTWCNAPQMLGATSPFQRLLSFLSPRPAPLNATLASQGPGGRAGSFTDFYAVGVPVQAYIQIVTPPTDAAVGDTIAVTVRTITSSQGSPVENAAVNVEVVGNNGLIPSDNSITSPDIGCQGFDCTGAYTLPDEAGARAGTLDLRFVISKTGSYTLCFDASLSPLQFDQVCSEKFNIRP
ncbi:MAG: hypothetical protein PVF05_05250 [Gemmatimonadales bacterium]|jgi:hypothetical protein